MDIYELLKDLTKHGGVTGFERDFAEYTAGLCREFCDEVRVDNCGCVIGVMHSGRANAKRIMLEAHLDRIGLIVSKIFEDGFVGFSSLGGVDGRILPASEVNILGKESVYGIIGAKPPHLTSSEDRSAAAKIEDMLIDTGMDSETLSEKISVGDPILIKSEMKRLLGGRISSAALDNRAGMAALLACAEKLKGEKLSRDVYIVFTSGEESGLHGAYTVAADIMPDLAVAVDVTFGETPDSPKHTSFPLGCGAVIFRGPNTDCNIAKEIIALAREKNIPYEIEVSGGSSGTDAWALQTAFGGVRCALVSIPLRYMHTSVEMVEVSDIEYVAELLKEIVLGGVKLD